MSGSEDSQNEFREQSVEMDSGTSPEKSASNPSSPSSHGLPKPSTRQRKKLVSDEEDSDFMPEETSTPSKAPRKTVRKVTATPDNLIASKYARKSTTLSKDVPAKKVGVKRPRKIIVHLVWRKPSMYEDLEDVEEEAPEEIPVPPKKKKLMADAMKSAPKTPAKEKKVVAPVRTTKDIPAATKCKGPACSAHVTEEEEDENVQILRKLRPTLPIHNVAHPIAEDMKKRKDARLRKWRANDLYVVRRRTDVDPRFHTKEQQDFYETVLFDKSHAYIKENENFFPHVQENFRLVDIEKFAGKEMTPWNDEPIMQFYATVHFYDDSLVWMTDGHKYEALLNGLQSLVPPSRKIEM
ncbi:hypothetical protein ZWY2020_029380 [Hordeum vulgare]|nr:hypothetical protein ZWY2020_029380 [Hordeum vulgare]